MSGDDPSATRTILVWDRIVRVGHWLLVLTVLFAWLTRYRPGPWHEWTGYASLAILLGRSCGVGGGPGMRDSLTSCADLGRRSRMHGRCSVGASLARWVTIRWVGG